MARAILIMIFLLFLAGCSSWFADCADKAQSRIELLRAEERVATTPGDKERLASEIKTAQAERSQCIGGYTEEQKNKQAMLIALISMGIGGIKLAGTIAAKGAI